jgi:hypothetical protein
LAITFIRQMPHHSFVGLEDTIAAKTLHDAGQC